MAIKFNKHVVTPELHSPLKNFELDPQVIEHRADPLTGWTSVIRTGRQFWQAQYITDEKLIAEIAAESIERCFFCPEKVGASTPRYPEDLIPGGRITVGEATLFPNLFAQKEYSAVAVISHQHFVPLDQFSPLLLTDAFKACSAFFQRIYEQKGARYCEIGFNYLFPAGSSLTHPHIQITGSNWQPTFLALNLQQGSLQYYTENNSCYWEDLVESERKGGERYIGRLGDTEWLTPFAPLREDEVHGIVRGKSNFLEFTDADWENLADGITRVFKFYREGGLSSCNFGIYSGPLGEKLDYFWSGVRIVARSSVQLRPINDVWFSQNIFYDGLVTKPPEDVASEVRRYF
ncbi:hypothetical protein ACFLVE_01950 [Chloroflexota bacterium]